MCSKFVFVCQNLKIIFVPNFWLEKFSTPIKGPAPERAKHIYHILSHSAEIAHCDGGGDNTATLGSIAQLITRKPLPAGVNDTVDNFMIDAVSSPDGAISDLLNFYSDLAHLAFGLLPELTSDEIEIVDRFESKWSQPATTKWLISAPWWSMWRSGESKPGQIDNKALFVQKPAQEFFVFEDRGQIPVENLKESSISVSRMSLDFLSDIYGAPAVMVCRPIVDGTVQYDVISINVFRHKYAQNMGLKLLSRRSIPRNFLS